MLRPSSCRLPGSLPTGSGARNASTWCGWMTNRPSGFFQSEAILARNLLGATPAEAVSGLVADLAPDLLRRRGRGRQAGELVRHVEVGLVERQRLDQRRVPQEDLAHLCARPRGSDRNRAARRPPADRAVRRAPPASPTARRTSAPRTRPRRPPSAAPSRRRRPADRAAPGCRAARPRRRTRPCRHGRSSATGAGAPRRS